MKSPYPAATPEPTATGTIAAGSVRGLAPATQSRAAVMTCLLCLRTEGHRLAGPATCSSAASFHRRQGTGRCRQHHRDLAGGKAVVGDGLGLAPEVHADAAALEHV